jgi:hypothetical protein
VRLQINLQSLPLAPVQVMDAILRAGGAVEDALGGEPQDIEGCWANGQLTVVQARPQVL